VWGVPVVLLTGVLVALLAGAYVLLHGSDWAFDDNIYLVLARQHGLTWGWLTDSVFGHFALGYRFGYSVLNHLMPIDYRGVMVLTLMLLGASAVTFFRVLELLFHRPWLALSMTICFAGSILFVRAIQWWAFGLQGIPTVLADLLCIYGYLLYQRERRWRWLALSGLALAFGLLFYEKAAFAPLYIALLRLLFLTPQLSWRSAIEIVRRERWIWLAYAAVLAVWYAGYRYSRANLGGAASPTAAQWVRFYEVGWLQSVVPAAFGFGMPWANIYTTNVVSSLQTVEIVVLQVVLVAAVVISVRSDHRAWRAWACLGFLFALSGFLTGEARITLYGPSAMAGDLRYWIDFAWLTPLFVCLAFLPRPEPAAEPTGRSGLVPPRRAVAGTVPVLLLAYLIAAGVSAHNMERLWPGAKARTWQANLERTLIADRRRWPAAVIAQAVVPFYIIEPGVAPINQLSFLLPHYDGYAPIDGPVRTGPILAVNPAGQAVPATPHIILRRLAGTGPTPSEIIRIALPAQNAPPPGRAYLRVSYLARRARALPLGVNTGTGLDASADHNLILSAGAHETIAWLGPNPLSRLTLTVTAQAGMAIGELDVVTLPTGTNG
jgi:hypothetical protein